MMKLKQARELLKAEKTLLKLEVYKEINKAVWEKFPEALKYRNKLIKKYLIPIVKAFNK